MQGAGVPRRLGELLAHAFDCCVVDPDLLLAGAAPSQQLACEHEPFQLENEVVELPEAVSHRRLSFPQAAASSAGSAPIASSTGAAGFDSISVAASSAAIATSPAST